MKLFGISFNPQIDSNIVTQISHATIIKNWLEEDGCGGGLELLYRGSSRDCNNGNSGSAFHSKCDNKGPTVVIIETTGGEVIGG